MACLILGKRGIDYVLGHNLVRATTQREIYIGSAGKLITETGLIASDIILTSVLVPSTLFGIGQFFLNYTVFLDIFAVSVDVSCKLISNVCVVAPTIAMGLTARALISKRGVYILSSLKRM